jgi:hypothetical protein
MITAGNLFPAVSLKATYKLQKPQRKDKTGTRTYLGEVSGLRSSTAFEVHSYVCSWGNISQPPPHGPLVQAALGAAPLTWAAGHTVSSASGTTVTFAAAHGLTAGQAICCGNEIRFAAAIVTATAVQLNAPFTTTPATGMACTATMTYGPAEELPSATVFDYWSPVTAVQRLMCGAAVDKMTINVNGDFHELAFTGSAADLVDSGSFQSGQAGLSSFPAEPAISMLDYVLVPGNLGEAWLGVTPWQAFTVTSAQISLDNDLQLRDQEFGFELARGISPGMRTVTGTIGLFSQDDQDTISLYQAARARTPTSMMLQLGQQQGQLMGIYMSAVVPEVPTYDDSQRRLQWNFQNSRAQGTLDNEIYIAFA